MKKQKFLQTAGILLFSSALLFSATAITTEPYDDQAALALSGGTMIVNNPSSATRNTLYNNGLPDGEFGLSCVVWSTFDREVVDDFVATDTWNVTGGACRIVTQDSSSSIPGLVMIFYQDVGGIPSTTAYATETATITCTLTGDMYFGRPEILVNCSINTVVLAPGTWWVCFQSQATENVYWLSANMNLHNVYVSYPDQGYAKWTDGNVVWPNTNYDVAWLLTGTDSGEDTTPPVTTCTLTGELEGGVYISDVTVTLSATDGDSGVNYTMYKLNGGSWTTYSAPFNVTTNGDHILYFYSVDNAGNIETEKSVSFTIIKPAPPITITIQGGLGISVIIKNTGTTDLTNIDWTITLDGSVFIFLSDTKSGTIPFLPPGGSETVKGIVLGLGNTGIAVTADGVEKSASGLVLLIFVLGVT